MMHSEVFEGQVTWSRDWRSIYLRIKGTSAYLQIEELERDRPLLDCEAFDPGSRPTLDDLLGAIPALKSVSWEEEPRGSFPSVELNAFLPGMRVAIIDVVSANRSIPAAERVRQKFQELLSLKNKLLDLSAR